MTEPNGQSTTTATAAKKSVVDDFFSALFANNTSHDTSPPNDTTLDVSPPAPVQAPATPVNDAPVKQVKYNTSHYHDKDNVTQDDDHVKIKRKRVLDEFDEYSLLSSKRRESNGSNKRNLSPRTEIEDEQRPILSKKDIDWGNVKPESRMLVRQLPKFIDKQAVMSHFSKYGEVLEVVQKTPYGFVHFENPDACAQAVQAENGQLFHGIILDLEICRKKPFFARVPGKEQKNKHDNKQRRDSSPPIPQQQNNNRKEYLNGNHGRHPQASPPRSARKLPYKHNDYRPDYSNSNGNVNGYQRYGNDSNNYRQQQPQQQQQQDNRFNGTTSFVNKSYHNHNDRANTTTTTVASPSYRDDKSRNKYNAESSPRYNGYNASPRYNGYNGSNHHTVASTSTHIIPRRQGNEVPMIQIVSWDSVAYGYTDYIERVLSSNGIRASSMTLTYSQSTRDQVVKQMILEGVKAIILIDHKNELLNKVYLQVFAPAEYGQAIRFDEYDSVTALEAVNIFYRMYPPSTVTQPVISPPPPPQAQPLQQQPQQPAVDMNTLASLYSMLQQQQQQQQQQVQPAVSPPTNQATIPQLLATLVNGLSTQPAQPPVTAYSPPPPVHHYPPVQPPAQDSNNIAALISTAAGGNPALAQLLAQMTTSVGATSSNELHK